LQVDQARRLKELEQENGKLKDLVSELSPEKLVLKDIASENVWSAPILQAPSFIRISLNNSPLEGDFN
jgi:putative transposase